VWYDVLGLDSEYDYDPVSAKCVELGIVPTFRSASNSQGLRLSPTNFTYNHIGHFAAAGHATAKAIFLGGVTRRFPELRFAFLEGGVGWASQLFGDLIEHWERRSAKALERMHPDKLDRAQLMSLVEKYGHSDIAQALRELGGLPDPEGEQCLFGAAEKIEALEFSAFDRTGLGEAVEATSSGFVKRSPLCRTRLCPLVTGGARSARHQK
jgi:hypothetical protein